MNQVEQDFKEQGGGGGSGSAEGSSSFTRSNMSRKTSIPSPRKSPIQRNGRASTQTSPSKSPSSNASPTPSSIPISKASFLCVKESLAEDLESKDEFELALQHAGYNPTTGFLDRYWKPTTSHIAYHEFHQICQTEPLPRKLDLISYFRQLDPKKTGLLPHDEFLLAMTRGGNKGLKGKSDPNNEGDRIHQTQQLSKELVLNLIRNPDYNKAGKFDYGAFCTDVFATSSKLVKAAKEKAWQMEEKAGVNSGTYKVKKKVSSPRKYSDKSTWKTSIVRGAFYFEADSIISHQFTFNVGSEGYFEILIQPQANSLLLADCQLFLFRLLDDNGNRNLDSKYQFVARTPLVLVRKNNLSDEDKRAWMGHLEKGTYLLIPSTTGCLLKRRKRQPDASIVLVNTVDKELQLSREFSDVLTKIYHQVDLDGNGTLSRTEFNLFNWRTSGEEVQDEEWQVVEENFALKNGELTLDGFLQLHQMEAEDNGGDSAELWITLNAMGYNAQLVQDEASPFEVILRSEKEPQPKLEVSGLKSGGSTLDKATIKCIMEHADKGPKKMDKNNEVLLFKEETPTCTSYVIQNRSSHPSTLNLDFSKSHNVLINHPHLAFTTKITPKSTLFVAHLIPKENHRDHSVILKESIV